MDPWYLVLCFSNAFLSYTATMLNIVTIHAIRKTPSLSKNLKTLLLSQAISDLGVGLLVQPIFVAQLVVESTQDNESSNSYNVIYIARLITTSFFLFRYVAYRHSFVRREIRFYSLLSQIPRTYDIQARCCCGGLNLGI